MLRMVEKEYIRKLHFRKGWSIRKISRQLQHSRVTVRKMLLDSDEPQYSQKEPRPKPKMDPYMGIITQWLEDDKKSPKKQKHTAKRVFDRLVEEYDFDGSESTVRKAVRELRGSLKECYLVLTANPGEQVQVDFGHATVSIDGEEVKITLFCMKFKYSKVPFVVAFRTEKIEAFLEGHVRAFEYFQGTPETGMYDNATTQVVKVLNGPLRKEHETFMSLRTHYLFDSTFQGVGKPNEKGSIEGLVGYVRRNALVPKRDFGSFEELNDHLLAWCEREKKRHSALWEEEQRALRPLPEMRYCSATIVPVKVNTYGLVNCHRNRYSVPSEYVGRTLLAKIYVDRIEITDNEKTVATHQRSYKKNETHMKIEHFLPVLEIKAHAVANARVIRELPPVFQTMRNSLKKTGPLWYREYVRILLLLKNHSLHELEGALLQVDSYSFENVMELLKEELPDVRAIRLESHEINKYEALFERVVQ